MSGTEDRLDVEVAGCCGLALAGLVALFLLAWLVVVAGFAAWLWELL